MYVLNWPDLWPPPSSVLDSPTQQDEKSNETRYIEILFTHIVCFDSDEAQEAEAIQVLNAIFDMRDHQPECKTEIKAKIAHATAMLYFVLHDIDTVSLHGHVYHIDSVTP